MHGTVNTHGIHTAMCLDACVQLNHWHVHSQHGTYMCCFCRASLLCIQMHANSILEVQAGTSHVTVLMLLCVCV